ncbi:MAG: hypothetical protein JOS17DRAFT_731846 [Linnemannia elongata]|nr:MAG: hypothetical protein JOS17DRAFT_731846 [Linnemannia elongata]
MLDDHPLFFFSPTSCSSTIPLLSLLLLLRLPFSVQPDFFFLFFFSLCNLHAHSKTIDTSPHPPPSLWSAHFFQPNPKILSERLSSRISRQRNQTIALKQPVHNQPLLFRP